MAIDQHHNYTWKNCASLWNIIIRKGLGTPATWSPPLPPPPTPHAPVPHPPFFLVLVVCLGFFFFWGGELVCFCFHVLFWFGVYLVLCGFCLFRFHVLFWFGLGLGFFCFFVLVWFCVCCFVCLFQNIKILHANFFWKNHRGYTSSK